MMNCSKCHGRKELEYHPLIYKAKNDKNTKFPHYTRDKINHKHETASKEEFCEKKRMENNYQQVMPNMIGAPFFQYDNKSVSSKTTRARSGGTYRNTDCNKVKKRKESVDSCSSKPEFSYKDSYHCVGIQPFRYMAQTMEKKSSFRCLTARKGLASMAPRRSWRGHVRRVRRTKTFECTTRKR